MTMLTLLRLPECTVLLSKALRRVNIFMFSMGDQHLHLHQCLQDPAQIGTHHHL